MEREAASAIGFKGGFLTSALELEGSALWRFDPRRGEWVAPAMVNAKLGESGLVGAWLEGIRWPACNIPSMRDYQSEAEAAWMRVKCGLVVLPTGLGKTVVALEIMYRTGVPTLVLAPTRALMHQWRRQIRDALGIETGQLGDGAHDVRPVTCATYHSAALHMKRLGDRFKLLICDEAHHLPIFADAARMCAAPWRLGLTATPERPDGRHVLLDELIGPVCFRMEISEAGPGVLAPYEVVRIPVKLHQEVQAEYDDLGRVIREYVGRRRRADPSFTLQCFGPEAPRDPEGLAARRASRRRQEIEDTAPEKLRVLEEIFARHRGAPTIVYVGSNAMALKVSLRFLIPPILCEFPTAERAEVLARFGSGQYPAVVANRILDEGIDEPTAKVGVVLGGRGSIVQAIQRLGRLLRPSEGRRAVIYEVVCQDTAEVRRSQKRRRTGAYQKTRHRHH